LEKRAYRDYKIRNIYQKEILHRERSQRGNFREGGKSSVSSTSSNGRNPFEEKNGRGETVR